MELLKKHKLVDTATKLIDQIDINGDGKISRQELFSSRSIKMLLLTLISLITPAVIEAAQQWILANNMDWSSITSIGSTIIIPFILLYGFKGVMDDYDGRLKLKDSQILSLEQKIAAAELREIGLQNKIELTEQQMEAAIQAKNMDISFIKGKK